MSDFFSSGTCTTTNASSTATVPDLNELLEMVRKFKPEPGLLSMKRPMMLYGDGITDEQAQQARAELVRQQTTFMPDFAAMEMRRSSVIDRDTLVFVETAPKLPEMMLPAYERPKLDPLLRNLMDEDERFQAEKKASEKRVKEWKARMQMRSYDVKCRGRNRVLHRQRKWMTRGRREILKSTIYHPAMSISITS